MNCQCQGIEIEFNQNVADRDLKSYLSKGTQDTTRLLVESLIAEGVEGLTLLDIGGGVGVIQYELFKAGVSKVISVDASKAYIGTARKEATRRGLTEKIDYIQGDFVTLAKDIPSANIVTLDRVICCYDDMENLVGLSAAHARNLYGIVYPRDAWWVKIGIAVINLLFQLRRSPFRTFSYSTQAVEAVLDRSGFKRHSYHHNLVWQVVVYTR